MDMSVPLYYVPLVSRTALFYLLLDPNQPHVRLETVFPILVFHHPQVLCSLIGYFNALAHVLGTSPCKLTSVPEFLLPRKALYLTAPSWRTFLPF